MKKSKTMRVASGLLVLTLLSTCMVAGTFAKYTTNAEGSDTARVAKFGVTVNADASESDNSLAAFSKTYAKTDTSASASIDNTVVADTKVVAPGTSGEMAKVKLTGKPEVAVRVNYAGEFKIDDNWKVDEAFYCPLVVTVKSANGETTIKQDTDKVNSVEAFNAAVNKAIEDYSQDYPAGTDLSKIDNQLTVSWNWPFEAADNTKDTKLGDAANANVTLKVTTTVTQID